MTMSILEARTGAGHTATARAIFALQAAGYSVEKSTVYFGEGQRGQYMHSQPQATQLAVYCDGQRIGEAEIVRSAWDVAAEHALRHRPERLPPAYSGPGTVWSQGESSQ